MSKYNALWSSIQNSGMDSLTLTFDEIEKLAGLPVDHSFLNCKKELVEYGYTVGKISIKGRTVSFERIRDGK